MLRIIFIVIVFLMMMGAFIGGLYYWGIDPLEKLGITMGTTPKTEEEQAEPAGPTYVDFGLLIVPVIQDREIKSQAELILRLDVAVGKTELVAHNLPRLQQAFLQDMMSFLPGHLRDGARLNQEIIRQKLLRSSENVLGAGLVNDISIEHAAVK